MSRLSVFQDDVVLNTAIGTTGEMLFGEFSSGMVFIPAGSSVTTLTWWAAPEGGGTYLAAYDYDGVAVTQTVSASKSYPIPLALLGCRAIKAVTNVAGAMDVSFKV